jgi:hypothetical protein
MANCGKRAGRISILPNFVFGSDRSTRPCVERGLTFDFSGRSKARSPEGRVGHHLHFALTSSSVFTSTPLQK